MFSEDQIERANSASIVDYFQSHGYECEKQGKDVHIKGFGGLVITDDKKYYQFSEQRGGIGLISCLRDIFNMTFPQAVQEIINENSTNNLSLKSLNTIDTKNNIKEKKPFVLPSASPDMKRVYAYMINQRKISPQILSMLIKNKLLYQDTNGNAIFIHRNKNNEPVGAEVQGTLSEKRFKGIVEGTGESAFVFDLGSNPDTAYIFESSIDLMSYIQLHPEITKGRFISMAGLKPNVLNDLIEQGFKIVSCVDNDAYGIKFNEKLFLQNIGLQTMLNKQHINFEMQTNDNFSFARSVENEFVSYFFSNADNYKRSSLSKNEKSKFFIANKSEEYFTVSNECKSNSVKDFNDLLKKKTVIHNEEKTNEKQNLKNILHNAKRSFENKDLSVLSRDKIDNVK